MSEKLRAGKIGIGYEVEQKMEQVMIDNGFAKSLNVAFYGCLLCTDAVFLLFIFLIWIIPR